MSSLSRLLTSFFQFNGFTCGLDDLLVKGPANAERARLLARADAAVLRGSAKYAAVPLVSVPDAASVFADKIDVSISSGARTLIARNWVGVRCISIWGTGTS